MDLTEKFDALEEKYYGEWEEDRDKLVAELKPIHQEALAEGSDKLDAFRMRVIHHFGGAFIPYVFWPSLRRFFEDPEVERTYLQETLKAFANSDFEEEETRRMKPLIVAYFTEEKEFELNKFDTLTVSKMHPAVREYFQNMVQFANKSRSTSNVYRRKFELVKDEYPDFDLMAQPITELRETMDN